MSDDELPRVLRLLWGREEPGRRGPRPRHSIGDIAAAAVRIADAAGLAGVSMSAVAADVGLTTMALYRYVDAKSDLYVAMVDAAYGPPPKQRAAGSWRRQLEAWASANRDALRRHPWIVQIPVSEPPLSPNPVRWMERGLRAFEETALTEQQSLSSLLLVDVYVRGQVLLTTQMGEAMAEGGLSSREADELYARRLARLISEDDFPCVHSALLSGSLQDGGEDFADEEFFFGLNTVLDGIEVRIDRHPTGRRRS